MNDSVISLICVAACRIETTRPTTNAVSSSGADKTSMTYSACWPMVTTLCGVMAENSDLIGSDQRADQQIPAVREHEQHQLERQRDQHGRKHHHPHRHQHTRDDHVDDEERNE